MTFSLNTCRRTRAALSWMTRRIELEPMSMMAMRSPLRTGRRLSLIRPPSALAQHQPRRRPLARQGTAAPGEAGIGHEVVMGGEGVRAGLHPLVAPVRLHDPTLRLVLQIGDHDLIENLTVDGRVLDRNE